MTSKYTQNQAYPLENRLAAFIQLSADQGVYKEKHTEICEYLGSPIAICYMSWHSFVKRGFWKSVRRAIKLLIKPVLPSLHRKYYENHSVKVSYF